MHVVDRRWQLALAVLLFGLALIVVLLAPHICTADEAAPACPPTPTPTPTPIPNAVRLVYFGADKIITEQCRISVVQKFPRSRQYYVAARCPSGTASFRTVRKFTVGETVTIRGKIDSTGAFIRPRVSR